jgi:ribonuclease G
MIERVHKTKDKEPLFAKFGVDKEISSTLDRRVDLPSGGYLVFDYAEAFTVIDVNTGSFVGSRSKSSTQRLEDTIVKNNLEAVKEVVRQLRLRDIGGIIVIDFIDMANPKNRQAVEDAFRTELERDRTKTYVVEISPLGLVEMTRQKVTDGPREVMTRKCPTCAGDGIVVSDATIALQLERRLKALAVAGAGSRVQAYRIALHPKELALLAGPGGERLRALEEATRRRFFLVPAEGHVHADHFEVLAEGRRDDLAPQTSLTEGAEAELKLVEIDLHDGTAAVGKLDGIDVVVADAAKLVGKKAKVTIGTVLEGQAFATLVAGEPAVPPITFESEAEKPTRAPARRKGDGAGAEGAAPEAETAVDAEGEAETAEAAEEAVAADDEPAEASADEEGQPAAPAKKRTRRGSRGGKRRKKPATTPDGADADVVEQADDGTAAATVEEGEVAAKPAPKRRTPRIHVPDDGAASGDGAETEATTEEAPAAVDGDGEPDGAGDGTTPRKRTRRGSRGGRSRKKKAAVAANGDGGEPSEPGPAETVAVELETNGDGAPPRPEPAETAVDGSTDGTPESPDDAGYVPMSEWIEDFDRRP